MARRVREDNGMSGYHRVERAAIRERSRGPKMLIPACATDPCARGKRARSFCDAANRFIDSRHALEVHGVHRRARPQQMRMGVREAG